ncbi:MAG: winged helix-turn-helix domain-containing protein [Halobacteriota archaeon]|nr:winged helix-turn-helix domain-containing protein [Halobacteriota archaeon]
MNGCYGCKKKNKFDRSYFGLLSSDTRVEILRALDSDCMTLKGLCDEFDLSRSTIHEHLNKLVDVNLIKQRNEGSKFVYYEITGEGEKLVKTLIKGEE